MIDWVVTCCLSCLSATTRHNEHFNRQKYLVVSITSKLTVFNVKLVSVLTFCVKDLVNYHNDESNIADPVPVIESQ